MSTVPEDAGAGVGETRGSGAPEAGCVGGVDAGALSGTLHRLRHPHLGFAVTQGSLVVTNALIQGIYDSGVAEWMRTTVKAMPIVEGIHLLSTAALFGTILIVDLRLLGIPDSRRSFTRLAREVLPWTWLAFAVNAVTGALMFAPNALTYASNTTFLLKMAALDVYFPYVGRPGLRPREINKAPIRRPGWRCDKHSRIS